MPAAPTPSDEADRLKALRLLRILDTPADPAFDELTRQAMEVCATPVALVSLVDEKRQWFKSRTGMAASETPRDQSICAHALLTPDRPLIVPDTRVDARFSDNPLVTHENGIRFYAGVPLRSPEGHALGTLCVIDYQPRQLSVEQLGKLRSLAQQVSLRLSLDRQTPAERRLAIGFGLGFAFLLCMALYFSVQVSRFLTSDQWVAHTNQVVRTIERTLFEVQAAESSQRGYTASGQDGYLPPYRAAVASLPSHLEILRAGISDNPVQVHRFDLLKAAIDTKLAIMQERFEQRRTLGAVALEAQYLNGSGRRAMETVINIGQKMIKLENWLLRQRAESRTRGLHSAIGLLAGTCVLGTALLAAGFLMTRRELRRSHSLGGALAHANMGLENEVAERRRVQQRLSVQHSVAHVAAEHLSVASAAPEFLRIICEHLDWELGELWTVDPAAGVLRMVDDWHRAAELSGEEQRLAAFAAESRSWKFARGEGFPGKVWEEGVPAWEHHLESSHLFARKAPAREAGLCRAFAFPLQSASDPKSASVVVFLSHECGPPDPELAATMNTLAAQIIQFAARCEAQAGLQASQKRFSAFIENAPALAYIKDETGHMLYGNETLLRTFGLTSSEWLGKTDFDFWPEATPAIRENDRMVLSGESAVEIKESVPLPDGSMGHWLSYKFPLRDEATGRKLVAGISIDITAREKAETALRGEREFLAALLDNLQAGVVAWDAGGKLTHCNRAAGGFQTFPAARPVRAGDRWEEFFRFLPGADGEPACLDDSPMALALQGAVTRDQEFVIWPKDGPERALSLNVTPFEDGEGHRLGAVAVLHDVTARRQAREAALVALHEKETLLQEVHHRVKNNLQVIGSLLSMQARRTKSPVALAALMESAGRVRSIALVHEKLYRAVDLEYVEAADYLRTLSRNLMDALGAERLQLRGRVSLDFDLEDGHQLDASVAIACGLILNEALTNSFKHGFPDERSGQVLVALRGLPAEYHALDGGSHSAARPQAASWLRLEVRDNGIGLPATALTPAGAAELARNSLGLRLVRDLTKQVAGRLEFIPLDSETGTGLVLRLDFANGAAHHVA